MGGDDTLKPLHCSSLGGGARSTAEYSTPSIRDPATLGWGANTVTHGWTQNAPSVVCVDAMRTQQNASCMATTLARFSSTQVKRVPHEPA
ncbi:hypothetical protein MTO96_041974 [Rhipicephalus appendiculatus]